MKLFDKQLLSQYKFKYLIILLLLVIETACHVVQFYLIGLSINMLLKGSKVGLYYLAAIFVFRYIVYLARELFNSKVYKSLYDALVLKILPSEYTKESRIDLISKSSVVFEFASFIKFDLVTSLQSILRLLFVFVMLFLMTKKVLLLCLITAVFMAIVFILRRKKIFELYSSFNKNWRGEPALILEGSKTQIVEHFKVLEAKEKEVVSLSWGHALFIELVTFVVLVLSLLILTQEFKGEEVGFFFSILYYVFAFMEVAFLLPFIYQKFVKIKTMDTAL